MKSESDSHARRNVLLTVAGERFSIYGIKSMLFLYLVKVLSMSEVGAGQFFGGFDGLIFTTPLLGGYLADRYFGYHRSIILGCILMTAGQIFLYNAQLNQLVIGLLIFVLGTGFFDPSMTAILGWLSPKDSKEKENAYMQYFVAINAGCLVAVLICPWIAAYYSWPIAFLVSGAGTLFGTIVTLLTKLPEHIREEGHAAKRRKSFSSLSAEDKGRIAIILALAFFTALYWIPYEQCWSSLMVFADRYTDRHIFGYEFPAPYFDAIDPAVIVMVGLIFTSAFSKFRKRGSKSGEILKLATSFAFLGASFAVLVIGMLLVFGENHEAKLSTLWVMAVFLISTMSQFFIIPVGLALVSKLAPQGYTGSMMGIWWLAYGIGNYISGALVGLMGNTIVQMEVFFAAFALACALIVAVLLVTNKRFQGRINSYAADG